MNSARKLDASVRNFRIVARRSETAETPQETSAASTRTLPYRGLRLVKSGVAEHTRRSQADTFEQARRIIEQIEQEILHRTTRERAIRLYICAPPAGHAILRPRKESIRSRLRVLAAYLRNFFSF